MSKSVESQGTVFLHDDVNIISKKFKRAVTDNEMCVADNREKQPGVTNLLNILSAVTGKTVPVLVQEFSGKGYGDFKAAVADAVVAELAPLQAEYKRLLADKGEIERILAEGAQKARLRAERKLQKVRKTIGFLVEK